MLPTGMALPVSPLDPDPLPDPPLTPDSTVPRGPQTRIYAIAEKLVLHCQQHGMERVIGVRGNQFVLACKCLRGRRL